MADLVDLQHFSAMPDARDRSGEQSGLDRLVDGGSVVGEAHCGESTDPAAPDVAVGITGRAGARLRSIDIL
jgi:hypothetical protein